MRTSQMHDVLHDAADELFAPEPMRPIRLEYVTTTRDRAIQTDLLERLGLVHVFAGQNLYALNEADSIALRIQAREQLAAEKLPEAFTTDAAVNRRAESLLRNAIYAQAQNVARSALHPPSLAAEKYAQELRAEADKILVAHGVELRARTMQAIAEHEAA